MAAATVPLGPRTKSSWLTGRGRRTPRTLSLLHVPSRLLDIPGMAHHVPVALEEFGTRTSLQSTLHLSFVVDHDHEVV